MKNQVLKLAALFMAATGFAPQAQAQQTEWVDVTAAYMTSADMSSGDGWSSSNFSTNNFSSRVSEAYAGWNALNVTSYSLTQQTTLPAGNYRLTGYAFFRQGQFYNTDASKSLGYMVAGDASVAVATLGSLSLESYANDVAQASATFYTDNNYQNTLDFTLSGQQETTIGYQGTFDAAFSWLITGAMTLSATPSEGVHNDLLQMVSTFESYPTAMQAAIDEAEATYGSSNTDHAASMKALMAVINMEQELKEPVAEIRTTIADCKDYLEHTTATEEASTTFSQAITTAETALNAATTLEAIETIQPALESARQAYVVVAEPEPGYTFNMDMTFLIRNADASSLDGWTTSGPVGVNSGEQHWSGVTNPYIEPSSWGADSWESSISQTVTLPNGHYTLRAAGRASTVATIALTANGQSATFASTEDVGGTIATDGTEWESVQAGLDAGKTFANNNAGRGWSYQTLEVTVLDNTMTIGATSSSSTVHTWCSIDDFQLTFVSGLTEEEQLTVAKNELQALVTEAGGINISANVGTEAFQIPEAAVEAFEEAYAAATELLQQTPAPTLDETEQGIADLQAAIEAYRNTPLNAPTADERFNIILATQDNFQYRGMAVTFIGGRSDGQGEYSLNYQAAPNANYAQAFTLEKADGTNNYLMSFTGTDGQTNYACTGTHYGASTGDYGIRTTTNRSLALPFEVIATATEGVYNLRNTVANEYMGSQSEGFYTVNSHIEFNIKPAAKAEVALQITDAGWATLMLPYSADVPDGLTAYTYSGTETDAADNTVLQLTEAAALAANTPYIIKGNEGTYNFSGYGLATQDTYSTDGMTGTLVQTAAPADSYVLQNQSGQTGFYKVEAGSEPTIGAYRAYLNADVVAAGVNVRLILLDDDSATGIDAVQNAKDAAVNVYNLNGILVRENVKASEALNGLQRGIYIVNGTKKAVK